MKQFEFITEADARILEIGSTVALRAGGRITPLAQDTLRARRITVEHAHGASDLDRERLAADVRMVAIGADHTGVPLKRDLLRHLRSLGLTAHDLGTHGSDPVDYPDVAAAVARAVARGEADAGIVIDGGGIGSAIAANKIPGIRAAMATDERTARYAREHTGTNVLTIGASFVTPDEASAIVEAWVTASIREARYIRRLEKIRRLERE